MVGIFRRFLYIFKFNLFLDNKNHTHKGFGISPPQWGSEKQSRPSGEEIKFTENIGSKIKK